jgi:hypothetical protein
MNGKSTNGLGVASTRDNDDATTTTRARMRPIERSPRPRRARTSREEAVGVAQ